jgi:hypothetical protein
MKEAPPAFYPPRRPTLLLPKSLPLALALLSVPTFAAIDHARPRHVPTAPAAEAPAHRVTAADLAQTPPSSSAAAVSRR